MTSISASELSAQCRPAVAAATEAVRAAARPEPPSQAVIDAVLRVLGVAEHEVGGVWMGLAPGEHGELCVDVELRKPGEEPRLVSLRRRGEDARALVRSGHFALSARRAPRGAESDVVRRVATRLLSVDPPGARVPSHAAGALLQAFANQTRVEREADAAFVSAPADASIEVGRDAASIRLLRAEYARYFGAPPPLRRCVGAPGASLSFSSRDLPDDGSFFTVPDLVRRAPGTARYLRALGFVFDSVGCVRTVPLPSTFIAARAAMGLDACGLRPVVVPRHSMRGFDHRWLDANARGELAINLGTRLYYTLARPLVPFVAALERQWRSHFTTLCHDMGVHLLSTQLVPREVFDALGRHVRHALGRRPGMAGLVAPRPLLLFYDTDVFLYARQCWERASDVAALPGLLAEEGALGELLQNLEKRLHDAGLSSRAARTMRA